MTTRRRRWLDVLRRNETNPAERAASESVNRVAEHATAQESLRESVQLVERLVGTVNRHKAIVDALPERSAAAINRAGELGAALERLEVTQGKLSILAINVALEGGRLEGAAGRAMVLVADELRALVAKATTASEELRAAVSALRGELAVLEERVGEARGRSAAMTDEAAKTLATMHVSERAMAELGEHLVRQTGLDPEVASAVDAAQRHARDLVAALTLVMARARGGNAAAALRPALEPLMRLVSQLAGEEPPAGEP